MSPNRDQTMSQFIERIGTAQMSPTTETIGQGHQMMEVKPGPEAHKLTAVHPEKQGRSLKCDRREASEIACIEHVVQEAAASKLYDENKHRLYLLTVRFQHDSF